MPDPSVSLSAKGTKGTGMDDLLRCPYCQRSVQPCEGERRAMRAHRADPYVPGRCPASGLTVEEAQYTRPAEEWLGDYFEAPDAPSVSRSGGSR